VILTQYPRPTSLFRRLDVIPFRRSDGLPSAVFALSPFHSHSYKCPLPQTLSFDTLTNARGVWGPSNGSTFNVPLPSLSFQPLAHSSALQGEGVRSFFCTLPFRESSDSPTLGHCDFPTPDVFMSHQSPVRRTCIRCTIGANLSLGQTFFGSPFRTFILCGRV